MKITLLSFLIIAVVISFSFKQIDTVNENNQIDIQTAIKPTMSTSPNTRSRISKNIVNNTKIKSLSPPMELIASAKEAATKQASVGATHEAINSSNEQPDPEDFIVDFVESGKPEAIMEHFAELRRARAELIENQMSAENNDPDWSKDLTQSFEAAEQVVPIISGINLAETDCRETICALHFGFDEGITYKEMEPAMSNIGIVLGTDVWVHHDAEPDGPIVYIARVNTALPELEQSIQQ